MLAIIVLAAHLRTDAFNRDTNDHTLFAHHSFVKLGPAVVFAIGLALQVDERVQSARERNDLRAAADLYPSLAVKAVGEGANRRARIAAQVIHLVSSLPTADDRMPLAIQPNFIGDI